MSQNEVHIRKESCGSFSLLCHSVIQSHSSQNITHIQSLLVGGITTSLKNMKVSLGWIFPIHGKINVMFRSPPTRLQYLNSVKPQHTSTINSQHTLNTSTSTSLHRSESPPHRARAPLGWRIRWQAPASARAYKLWLRSPAEKKRTWVGTPLWCFIGALLELYWCFIGALLVLNDNILKYLVGGISNPLKNI